MKSIDGRNNIKIYNLSAGRTLPDWLSDSKKRKLAKRDVDIRRRIELIQDFTMPDISNCVNISPDGQYILATGTYKPRVKCFEVAALSQKFERCFDSEVVDFKVLSEDYSKLVFLQEERYVEFHNQAGSWFRTRIPKFGRDLAYHYPSCELYIATSGSEICRLNLNEGKFLNSLQTNSVGVNKCVFNPVHYLFSCGTEDGCVESWDPRSRHRVGILDCALNMVQENVRLPQYKTSKEMGVTSLAYKGPLLLAVGTQTGQILLYDIRSNKPLLVKDHMDGFPVKALSFDATNEMVFSLSRNALKIWYEQTGKPHTSIESDVKFNGMCAVPNSGMVFLATEDPKMQIYFLPSLGPAPKWCGHLDALIEELEEDDDVTSTYDDYKFVTEKDLQQLGLETLIGTKILRAVMHGYYIDARLYKKAQLASNIVDKELVLKKKVKKKIQEETEQKILVPKLDEAELPDINKEYFRKLTEYSQKPKGDKAELSSKVLNDPRFKSLFTNEDTQFDRNSEAFKLIQPLSTSAKGKVDRLRNSSDSETDDSLSNKKKRKKKSLIKSGVSHAESSSSASGTDEAGVSENSSDSESDFEIIPKATKSKRGKKTASRLNVNVFPEVKENVFKNTEFTSVHSLDDLEDNSSHLKKMSLDQRLQNENSDDSDDGAEEEGKVDDQTFGRREMKFSLKDAKDHKFEALRNRQKQHQRERKQFARNTKSIRGKIRMNKPFI